MGEAYICDAVRSPIGRRGGTLSATRADDLAAMLLNAVVERSGVSPSAIEDVVMGCVTQVGEQGWNIGRMAALAAGMPVEVSGVSINRMCGSSLQATNQVAHAIIAGQQDLAIAAGVECMSRTPMGSDGNGVSPKVSDRHQVIPQGLSAELIAERWGFTREQLDEYASGSHQRALIAIDQGRFDNEVVPVQVATPEGALTSFDRDETPRDSSLETLAGLPPAFRPDGVVTAGNASQICDGAAAVLLASERALEVHGLTPRARIVSTAVAGVDPTIMLTGNPPAMLRALDRAGLALGDLDVIEINEAFAVVPLQAMHDLGVSNRWDDVNPNGGGISLGHPLGASGCRILATLVNELDRRDARFGIASMCVGFGMGVATVIERVRH